MAGAAPVLRPLLTVLDDVGTFDLRLVLVRGSRYASINDLIREARRVSASGPPKIRKELTDPVFWATKDADDKVVIMRLTSAGPEAYMVEAGSRTPVYPEALPPHQIELGRARAGYRFGGKHYEPGGIYDWQDLPSETRHDLLKQAEDLEYIHGMGPKRLQYRFQVMPHAALMSFLANEYQDRLEKAMNSRSVASLARSIEREGLQYPPAVDEGWKRALALASLGMDMPFFGVVPPFLSEEALFSPAVEGRS
jgi:hypothetical protein